MTTDMKQRIQDEARQYLIKTAVESIMYVACGRVMNRDFAAKYGVSEDEMLGLIYLEARTLHDQIVSLGREQ